MIRLRDKIGLLAAMVFLAIIFYGTFQYYPPGQFFKQIGKPLNQHPDGKYLQQLSCIQPELDARQVVGFFTAYREDDHDRFFRLTQYGLAPVIVDDSLDHRLVVGYFPGSNEWQNSEYSLALVKKCPSGLFLLEKGDGQ
jgi:hypothetical protein